MAERSPGRSPGAKTLHQGKCDVDIAARCIRVWANNMRFIDQRLNLVPSHTRYRDLQLYLYAETCRNWAYAHGSLNVGLGRQSNFFTGCHQFKGPQKACSVTGCAQLKIRRASWRERVRRK